MAEIVGDQSLVATIGFLEEVVRRARRLLAAPDIRTSESCSGTGPRGSITKQGPPLVRWAAIEAVSKNHGDDPIRDLYRRVSERRGRNKGRVAAARKLLTLVYYGLRDGEIRSLAPPEAA